MSRNYSYILALLLLGFLAFWAIKNGKNIKTLGNAETAFAFKDTADIQQIKITDRETRKVLLQKQLDGKWRVNEQYAARKDGIAQLLKTLYKLQVVSPSAHAAKAKVLEALKNPLRTVEIFTDNPQEPARTIYIGSSGPDGKGNYALIKGQDNPYVVSLPAFEGQITPVFFTQEMTWRDRTVFDYTADQIGSVRMDYTQMPQYSFEIRNMGSGRYNIAPLNEAYKMDATPNVDEIAKYMNAFGNKQSEAFLNDYPQLDSLEKATPYCRLTVKTKDGQSNQVIIFTAPVTARSKAQSDAAGRPMKYDIDRYFAFINEGHDLVIIQTFVFGQLFKKYSDFFAVSAAPQ